MRFLLTEIFRQVNKNEDIFYNYIAYQNNDPLNAVHNRIDQYDTAIYKMWQKLVMIEMFLSNMQKSPEVKVRSKKNKKIKKRINRRK